MVEGSCVPMQNFAAELIRLAHHVAASPDNRAQLADALRHALGILDAATAEATPTCAAAAACPLVTTRVANALDGLAAALGLAADHAACIADRAQIIAERPHFAEPPPARAARC